MNDMMAAMEHEFQEAENEARHEFESVREEIKNRNSEEYNVLKIQLEGTIEELERHFEHAHQAYLSSTESRTNAFRLLTKNDAASARIIEKRMRKLIRLQDSLAHWWVAAACCWRDGLMGGEARLLARASAGGTDNDRFSVGQAHKDCNKQQGLGGAEPRTTQREGHHVPPLPGPQGNHGSFPCWTG